MPDRPPLRERIEARRIERDEQKAREKALESQIAESETDLRKRAELQRLFTYIAGSDAVLLAGSTIIAGRAAALLGFNADAKLFAWIGVIVFVSEGALFSLRWVRSSSMCQRLEELRARERVTSSFSVPWGGRDRSAQDSYFDRLVKINVENLAAYYSLLKAHTNNSFYTAPAGATGFLLIGIGIAIGIIILRLGR